jgi:hypothetical protein
VAETALRQIAAAVEAYPRDFVTDNADEIAEAATERLATDTGGDFSLSGAPAELSVDVDAGGSSATITAEGGGGQWTWLEEGTLAHQQPVRGFLHPGTEGKSTWSDPVAREMRRLPHDADERFREAMRSG